MGEGSNNTLTWGHTNREWEDGETQEEERGRRRRRR